MKNGSLGVDPAERDRSDPLPPVVLYSTAKPDEGAGGGELWAVFRALLLVVSVVLVLGWLVA